MHIQPTTLSFLKRLAENNDRDWFQQHRDDYEAAWQNMKDFVQQLIIALATTDRYIHADIPVSKCLFRIYRDTRFSKDKTPYKNWLGAGISTAGRNINGPEYYLHIQPGNSFFASGYWRPEKEFLAAIRQEIDYNGEELTQILADPIFSRHCTLDKTDTLKRPPMGYSESHPHIDLLKLKSFTALTALSDSDLGSTDAIALLRDRAEAMSRFKFFLHRALGNE